MPLSSAFNPSGLASTPMPTLPPSLRSSVCVTITVPSERRDAVHASSAPKRIEATVKVSPSPRVLSATVQGASPAASASDARHTSPATMQMPVRTPSATASPIVSSPTTAPVPASAAPTSPRSAVYSADDDTPPVGGAAREFAP